MTTTEELTVDEAWDTETGLLDDYVGTVKRSWFATDARYMDGNVILLHWEIATTDPEHPEVTEKFPVGSGWDSSDGGATVVHEKGKQKFNVQSIYGKIVKQVTADDGTLHAVLPFLKKRGRPTQANVWEGLTFHFKAQDFNYGGDIGTKTRVMPQEFLGEGAQPEIPGTNGTAAPGTHATPAAAPAAETATVDADPVVVARLRKAATEATDHQAFLDAAMEIDGVTTNDALMASLVDDSPSGFFATARA